MKAGDLLIGVGIVLVVIGIAWRAGWLSWFGNLPGDFRSEGERTTVFAPVTSMLILSVVGSILVNLVARLFRGE